MIEKYIWGEWFNALQKIGNSLKNNEEEDDSNEGIENSIRFMSLESYVLESNDKYSINKELSKTDKSSTIL